MIENTNLEAFHLGLRHRLFRGRTAEGPVVVKTAAETLPAANAIVSLRREYELLRNLDLDGVVRVVELTQTNEGLKLVMKDAGSGNLAERLRSGPLPIGEFLDVAISVAESVGRIHGARIVHRDINPGNLVWDATSRTVTLVDFGVATPLRILAVGGVAPAQLEGTLAYMSPEQTGRTGLAVDSRTDLYSLGATFYELLTGRPPFTTGDPIELIHAHIVRRPLPPHELNSEVPVALSRIVLKLLEKEPGKRYQAAHALAVDLRKPEANGGRETPSLHFRSGDWTCRAS